MESFRREHEMRYANVTDHVPGTRSYHQTVPLDQNRVGSKRCSSDDAFECIHDFSVLHEQDIIKGTYAAVVYEENRWISLVTEKFEEEQDVKVKFMLPEGPAKFLHWPQHDNTCSILNHSILQSISMPTASGSARYCSLPKIDEN